jgi:acetolactate synthase-1/2/3 large subunit
VDALCPALDAAFAAADSGKPACVNVKIAKSDFRKGAISV